MTRMSMHLPNSLDKPRFRLFFCMCLICLYRAFSAYMVWQQPIPHNKSMQMGSEKAIFMPNNVGPAEIHTRADSTSPLICFIITLNPTLPPVMLQNNISCLPFIGSGVNEYIFSHVSADVQTDLLRQTLSRGAHYTNNKSVSIAWNHMLVCHCGSFCLARMFPTTFWFSKTTQSSTTVWLRCTTLWNSLDN